MMKNGHGRGSTDGPEAGNTISLNYTYNEGCVYVNQNNQLPIPWRFFGMPDLTISETIG